MVIRVRGLQLTKALFKLEKIQKAMIFLDPLFLLTILVPTSTNISHLVLQFDDIFLFVDEKF